MYVQLKIHQRQAATFSCEMCVEFGAFEILVLAGHPIAKAFNTMQANLLQPTKAATVVVWHPLSYPGQLNVKNRSGWLISKTKCEN